MYSRFIVALRPFTAYVATHYGILLYMCNHLMYEQYHENVLERLWSCSSYEDKMHVRKERLVGEIVLIQPK